MTLLKVPIADLRGVQADSFPDTCTIQTPTDSVNTIGETTQSMANTYTNVPCRLAPMTLKDRKHLVGDQLQVESLWILSVAHDQDIAADYLVIHGGLTYRIVSMDDKQSWRTATRVVVERLD